MQRWMCKGLSDLFSVVWRMAGGVLPCCGFQKHPAETTCMCAGRTTVIVVLT